LRAGVEPPPPGLAARRPAPRRPRARPRLRRRPLARRRRGGGPAALPRAHRGTRLRAPAAAQRRGDPRPARGLARRAPRRAAGRPERAVAPRPAQARRPGPAAARDRRRRALGRGHLRARGAAHHLRPRPRRRRGDRRRPGRVREGREQECLGLAQEAEGGDGAGGAHLWAGAPERRRREARPVRARGFTLLEVLAVIVATSIVFGVALSTWVGISRQTRLAMDKTGETRPATPGPDAAPRPPAPVVLGRHPARGEDPPRPP